MGVREVFEVLYSPVKAFKKIVEKPDFKEVLLILVLFMSFTLVEQYVIASKLLLRTGTPEEDDWTESAALWICNGELSLDDIDYKVGNQSVESFFSNGTSIWMKLMDIGPLDCSGDNGYEELFFWIKWIHEDGTFPSSDATLRLFSNSESNYFEFDLTSLISNSSGEWNNVTLQIGSGQDWTSTNLPDWQNVTGLEFRLVWLTSANLTIKIDDLHFRRYVSSVEAGTFSGSITLFLLSAAIEFSVNWILWAGILLLLIKIFREEGGLWTVFFVFIGYVFIVTVVYTIVNAALFSIIPTINVPSKVWPPTTEEEITAVNTVFEERLYPNWAFQVLYFLPFIRELWIAILCAIAIRLLLKITWGKAASISIGAFVMRFVLRFFFGF